MYNRGPKLIFWAQGTLRMDRISEERLRELLETAVQQFGAQCLWNIQPDLTPASMRVMARQLKTYGNMTAWRLGTEIEAELDRAA